jgi:hypothetical protein
LPAEAVVTGMRVALELCSVAPELVAIEARRAAGEHLAEVVPIRGPECEERALPALSGYDVLLGGEGGIG